MDAFFASIEELKNPDYKKIPLIVAKDPRKNGGKGVVTTANYNARKFGVHSAISAIEALKLCPDGIFQPPDFDLYRNMSQKIHDIFHEYTDIIETVALDEAYLDVTKNKKDIDNPVLLAHLIQSEIWEKTKLTSSAGISFSKFLAKEASDFKKPAGITVISENDSHDFLMALPIEKYRGVGKKTLIKMNELNIKNGFDLYKMSQNDLIHHFGKFGYILFNRVRGIDNREVSYNQIRKSVGKERTYGKLLSNESDIESELLKISKEVINTVKENKLHGKTIVIKIRYHDFKTITKRTSFDDFIENDYQVIFNLALELINQFPSFENGVRLIGITLTTLFDLKYENIKLDLFDYK
ncbi:DNA polymerase IV [Lactobacillus sp. S2-2]|nr:DNA polymerase IV [Lactobacillus sp. S2-2]